MYCIYNAYTKHMSGIYREIILCFFHWELCCVEKFCLLHWIALNHGMGLLHWNSQKYKRIEFWYPLHIHSIYQEYTTVHVYTMEYTWYIPSLYLIRVPDVRRLVQLYADSPDRTEFTQTLARQNRIYTNFTHFKRVQVTEYLYAHSALKLYSIPRKFTHSYAHFTQKLYALYASPKNVAHTLSTPYAQALRTLRKSKKLYAQTLRTNVTHRG